MKIKDLKLNYAKCKEPCAGCDYNEGWNDAIDEVLRLKGKSLGSLLKPSSKSLRGLKVPLIEKLIENNTTDGLLDYKGIADDVIKWYFKNKNGRI